MLGGWGVEGWRRWWVKTVDGMGRDDERGNSWE